jgi:hypothetical protein
MIIKANRTPKFMTRKVRRCRICGRARSVLPEVRPLPDLFSPERLGRLPAGRPEGFVVTR